MGKCRGSLKVVQQVRFRGLKLVSLCFSFYYSKHQRNPRPPYPCYQNAPLASSNPSHTIWNWLCCFSIFVKSSFTYFVENHKCERGILSSTNTESIPNWSVHCLTVARTLRSRWAAASRWGSASTGEMGSWAMADFKADFNTPFFKEFSLFQVETRMLGEISFRTGYIKPLTVKWRLKPAWQTNVNKWLCKISQLEKPFLF